MASIVSERMVGTTQERAWPFFSEKTWGWIGLSAIVLLAGVLYLYNLDALGYANHY